MDGQGVDVLAHARCEHLVAEGPRIEPAGEDRLHVRIDGLGGLGADAAHGEVRADGVLQPAGGDLVEPLPAVEFAPQARGDRAHELLPHVPAALEGPVADRLDPAGQRERGRVHNAEPLVDAVLARGVQLAGQVLQLVHVGAGLEAIPAGEAPAPGHPQASGNGPDFLRRGIPVHGHAEGGRPALRDRLQVGDAGHGRAALLPARHLQLYQKHAARLQVQIERHLLPGALGCEGLLSSGDEGAGGVVDRVAEGLLFAIPRNALEPDGEAHGLVVREHPARHAGLDLKEPSLAHEGVVGAHVPGPALAGSVAEPGQDQDRVVLPDRFELLRDLELEHVAPATGPAERHLAAQARIADVAAARGVLAVGHVDERPGAPEVERGLLEMLGEVEVILDNDIPGVARHERLAGVGGVEVDPALVVLRRPGVGRCGKGRTTCCQQGHRAAHAKTVDSLQHGRTSWGAFRPAAFPRAVGEAHPTEGARPCWTCVPNCRCGAGGVNEPSGL